MELRRKLEILADAAKYDASCASGSGKSRRPATGLGSVESMGICHSYTPDGRCISLLKLLLTNHCIFDCRYCINRISSDTPRARFLPEEVIQLTLDFYRRNYIEGLFLSSGVMTTPDQTMDEMVTVAQKLREEHSFSGYIHLKAVAGASSEALEKAAAWADRVSANIELPTPADLSQLAPAKSHPEIEGAMDHLKTSAKREKQRDPKAIFLPAGQSTQMIIGATPSPDRAILTTASKLYLKHELRRVYYSAFSPIPDSDPGLPSQKPSLVREHRLYQADWLLRFYGFNVDEIAPDTTPNLSLELDPKVSWALRNRHLFPVDVNRASRALLLRVPGLGVRNVDRILKVRRFHRITLADLQRLRVPLKRTSYFIVTADENVALKKSESLDLPQLLVPPKQLNLFDTVQSSRTGEL